MKDLNWDDLQIFYHVAEHGGLSAAAGVTGLSAPTIGRRMLAFEQKTGQVLFIRSQTGYGLTAKGQALLKKVSAMRLAALPVSELLNDTAQNPLIRLSAGTGTAMFLASRFSSLQKPGDLFRLSFVASEQMLDLLYREIDLGIRNRPAETGNLASRRLATLSFAPYRSRHASHPDLLDWVAMDLDHVRHPAARWVHEQGHRVAVLASSVSAIQQLVKAGAGIGVMPCMTGDVDPSLVRAGPLIEELRENQYLVMHNDDRHRPILRRLIARIVQLYEDHAALLAGEQVLHC